MQQWTTIPVPYTRDDARTYLRHIIPGGWETDREWGFVMEARDEDGVPRFAGTISLRNEGVGRAEIAYGSHPWVRGRGVTERALRLLLEWGFAERDLQTVIWLARRGNWASYRLAWRLGFSFDGTLRSWIQTRDGLVDAWAGTLRRGEAMAPRTTWLRAPRIVGDSVVLRATVEADIPRLVEGAQRPPGAEVQREPPQERSPRRGQGTQAGSRPPRGERSGHVGDVDGGRRRDRRVPGLDGAVPDPPRPRGRGRLLDAPRRPRPRRDDPGVPDGGPARVHRHRGRRARAAPALGVRRSGQPRLRTGSWSDPASSRSASSATARSSPTGATSTPLAFDLLATDPTL